MIAFAFGLDLDFEGISLFLVVLFAFCLLPLPIQSELYPLNPPAWSLFQELLVNFAYAYFLRRLTSTVLKLCMIVSAVALLAGVIVSNHHMLDLGWNSRTFVFGFFRVGYSFCAGILLQRVFVARPVPAKRFQALSRNAAATPILLGLIAGGLVLDPPTTLRPFYDLFMVFVGFPAILYVGIYLQPNRVTTNICKFFGNVSYPIYVVHALLGLLVGTVLVRRFQVEPAALAPWGGFALIVFLILSGWFIAHYVDVPIRRMLGCMLSSVSNVNRVGVRDSRGV